MLMKKLNEKDIELDGSQKFRGADRRIKRKSTTHIRGRNILFEKDL